jgi:hypothetical protein
MGPFVSVVNTRMNGLSGRHVIFTGANVHIRDGSGVTDDNTTMLLGSSGKPALLQARYRLRREPRDLCPQRLAQSDRRRRPGHQLCRTIGGFENIAGGAFSSASGVLKITSGLQSSVGGSDNNIASGFTSPVSGGESNMATAFASVVSDGNSVTASAGSSGVGDGELNNATAVNEFLP